MVNKSNLRFFGIFILVVVVLAASVFFVLADFVDDGSAVQNVTDCGVLNTSYAVYTLNQSIGSGANGDCITIANDSIVLDCAGYNITFGNATGGIGILNLNVSGENGYENITIKNCNIYENTTGFNGTAIFFGTDSENATIFNNTITTQGNETWGMFFDDHLGISNISSNTLIVSGNESVGITITSDSSVSMDSNDITITGILSTGIIFWVNITNSNVTSNNINISVSDPAQTSGIFLLGGSNSNLLYNNTITTSGGGIAIEDSTGTNVSSNTVISSAFNLSSVYLSNASSSILENNNITTSSNLSAAIILASLINVLINSNNVTTTGNDSAGVLLEAGTTDSNITSNTITTSGGEAQGVYLGADCNNMRVNSNIIMTFGENSSGILMGDDSINGTIFDNTITTSGNRSSDRAMGGIFLETGTSVMNVSSNNITTSGVDGAGIWIWGDNSSIDNNTITASGELGDGIYLADDVQGINLTSNTINVTGNASYGIYSVMSENSSLLFYNNVITTSANHSDGIHLQGDNYNNISSNNITTLGYDSFGVYFNESHHAILSGNIVKTGEADSYVLYLLTASNHSVYNNIFNTSTSGSGVSWISSEGSYFNTTNTTSTNIVGKNYTGGNFWTNVNGTGYSDSCTNLDSDYFCDSIYYVINSSNSNIDFLPLSTKIGWNFNGTVMNVNGAVLNNSVINISIYSGMPPTLLGSNSSNSGETGVFNTFIEAGLSYGSYMYKSVITHANASTGTVDYVGQVLPMFPYPPFSALSDVNFYLKEAGTINVTAVNATGSLIPFGYMIKDTKLGYEVSINTNTSASGALVYVPRDRNYSIMIWPADGDSNNFVPVSYNWNNFSGATVDYNIGSLSKYNYTTKVLSKQFNISESFSWVSGYINKSDIASWDNFTIVPYLLEPSGMVGMTRGGLPYNASAWRSNATGSLNLSDQYNVSTGFYNITLPYSATETVRYLLLAVAENDSIYYGSYRNITVNATNETLNFTMYGFFGNTSSIINMSDSMGGSNHIINLTKQTFNLVNASSTNQTLSNMSTHIEINVDYSDYNCTEFTFMEDISMGSGSFSIPLLNMSGDEGFKEMNVYSQTYAPRRVGVKSGLDIQTNPNVTMGVFSPGSTSGVSISGVQIGLYISNFTCDVPNPSAGCVVASSANLSNFNPLKAVIGGGALSFRMGLLSTGIVIHYVNVDLLASGPPSGEFESGTSESTSGGFESALKFGSNGPTIYDYILISMPYTEGSSSVAGLNESAVVNLSVSKLYDESWSSPIWDTSLNGTNGTLLAGNYSHYLTSSSEWETLMGNNACGTNVSEFNSTNPCYINTTSNRIWIRVPHFSGTEPSITGSATTVVTTSSDDGSSSSGGGGDPIYQPTEERLREGYTLILRKDYKVKFNVGSESHTLNVDSVGEDSVQVTVSSEPQTKTLSVGDEVKFELDGDNVYDFSVKLESIGGSSAKLLMKRISEEILEEEVSEEGADSLIEDGKSDVVDILSGGGTFWIWLSVIVIVLIAIIGIIYSKLRNE